MLSRASMTGTDDLMGGDTLAGGGASEAGDRMLALLLGATACAPRAVPARRDRVSAYLRRQAQAARTCLVEDGDFFIIAGILSDRYQARSIALAALARKGLRSRRACASRISDGSKQA